MSEYIIVNKTALSKMRDQLDKEYVSDYQRGQIELIDAIISFKSTPLIPEIEKAFDEGKGVGIISYQPQGHTLDKELYNERKKHYISNLKLDI